MSPKEPNNAHCGLQCLFTPLTDDCRSCFQAFQDSHSSLFHKPFKDDKSLANSGPPPASSSHSPNQPNRTSTLSTTSAPEHPTPSATSTTIPPSLPFHPSQPSLPATGSPASAKPSTSTRSESSTNIISTNPASPTQGPSAQTSAPSESTAVKAGANEHLATILGVVCGVLSFLLLCLAFWFFLRQRSRRRQRRDSANNWQWFRRYDKWKDVYSPSVKGGDLPDYDRVESGERRRSEKPSHGRASKLTEGNLEMLERHSSRSSSIRSHNTIRSGKSSNSQQTLRPPSKRRDLRRVFSMGALTHTTGTTSKSALVIALPPESHPKQTHGSSPSSKVLQLLRTYDPVQSPTGPRSPGQIRNTV